MDGEEKKEEVLALEWHNTGVVHCWELHKLSQREKALQAGGSDLRTWQFSSASILSSSHELARKTSTPLLGHAEPSAVSENLQFTNNVNN